MFIHAPPAIYTDTPCVRKRTRLVIRTSCEPRVPIAIEGRSKPPPERKFNSTSFLSTALENYVKLTMNAI